MTDEFNFGTYTREEVNEEIERALEQERERSAAAVMVAMVGAYALGVICGALVL
jgi:hypothetical protein